LPSPAFVCRDADVEVVRWTGEDRELLGVLHHGEARKTVEVHLASERSATCLWPDSAQSRATSRLLSLDLMPFSAQVWELHQ
jgi:hypothetical protein